MAGKLFAWRDELRDAPELIASDRHVLLEISLYMDEHGQNAWPGTDRVVRGTAMKRATVLSSLAWALEAGWLTRSRGSKRERYRYAANITPTRKTRDDREQYMKERKRLASIRAAISPHRERRVQALASRSKSATGSVGLNGAPREQVEMGTRVGLNGDAESVEMGDHGTPMNSPKNSHNPSPTAVASPEADPDDIPF